MDIVDDVFAGKGMVAVYGAGYVGLSVTAVLVRHKLRTILVDIDDKKIDMIKNMQFHYIEKEVEDAIRHGIEKDMLSVTSDGVEASRASRIKIVTVPVYLDWDLKEIDYMQFENALRDIAKGLKKGDLVIIESSVPPGTTEEVAKPILEEVSGLRAEIDFLLAYSPERIYVGRAVKDIEENYPKVVAGIGPRSTDAAAKFYERIAKKGVLKLRKPRDAEFEKLVEGVYRDVNIALANELALAAMYLGVDFYIAREAANTVQPHVNIHLPGPGVGGACVPVYPYFIINKLLEKHYVPSLMLVARRVNEQMPLTIVKLVEKSVQKYSVKDKPSLKVVILGAAFRGEIDDTRLSPSHDIVALLKARGYKNIWVHDPYVRHDPILDELGAKLTNNLVEALRDADVIVVATRHKAYKNIKLSKLLSIVGKEPIILDAINYLDVDIDYKKLITLGKPSHTLA